MATEELCLICWARGRGGMNLGPDEFNMTSKVINGGGSGAQSRMRNMNKMGRNINSSKSVRSSTTGHSIHMRGLPFESTESDVRQFFAPFHLVDVRLLYEESGRPKGECDVDLATHSDAEAAMMKDKENMGHRYIELFLNSTEDGKGWNNSSNHNNNNNHNSINSINSINSNNSGLLPSLSTKRYPSGLSNRVEHHSVRNDINNNTFNNAFTGVPRGSSTLGRGLGRGNFPNGGGFPNHGVGGNTYSSFPKTNLNYQNNLRQQPPQQPSDNFYSSMR